ncbi:MAG: response regulator [Actinophytocola sp.]|uniref:hybrid sensor histidine kinase/response regulator n=1 Tax=Actinophytocola sp. TaxID=1872138 RepID=UPI0013267805|nr:ATP-binding protein [Actinophytocola sp.]MPZ80904.1 response regulator [Actinophytocola sp.]
MNPPDYQRLFDAAPTPYLVLDPALTIVAVNEAYLAATTTRRDMLVGVPIFSAFPANPEDRGADGVRNLRRSLEIVFATGASDTMAPQRYDIQVGESFEERWWSPINTPILAEDGTITHIIHRVLDVTDLVRSGRGPVAGALARLSGLEADLLARAREVQDMNLRLRLTNDELAATGEALRQQQRAKDRFIATLSHELRNPLAAIQAAVELLALDVPVGHAALAVLARQTGALIRMTDDLLDATRALTGRLALDRQRVDLRSIVSETAADVAAEFAAGRRALRLTLPSSPVPVSGDRIRLAQLLSNLVSNALKYTAPGATVVVSVATAGHEAVLDVRDDGIGFDPAVADSLFEVFTRAAPSGMTAVSGLGLGLAIVRSISELHDGTVTAHSDGPGTGAEFRVRLPLASAPEPDSPHETVQGARTPLRFLVIEDNADLAATYRALLERRGDTVTVAATGKTGLAAVAASRYDVVLCDLGLPDIGGLQIARHLRGHLDADRMKLVAVSGFIRDSDRQQVVDAGFDAYLPKPMTLSALDRVLTQWSADVP